jgi:hypothetical protein
LRCMPPPMLFGRIHATSSHHTPLTHTYTLINYYCTCPPVLWSYSFTTTTTPTTTLHLSACSLAILIHYYPTPLTLHSHYYCTCPPAP